MKSPDLTLLIFLNEVSSYIFRFLFHKSYLEFLFFAGFKKLHKMTLLHPEPELMCSFFYWKKARFGMICANTVYTKKMDEAIY